MVFSLLALSAASPAGAFGADAEAVRRAILDAKSGATVMIPAGVYDIGEVKIARDLTLVGDGDVVLKASRPVEKGILNPLPGVSLRVENITFRGARSPDLNGAGIRHDGENLTIVNCAFDRNENGVLATGSENGAIVIEASSFTRNGHGDGYSHGIYVSSGASLDIEASSFIATRIGHHVKSLAGRTRLANSTLDDTGGATSYALDASRGGDVTVIGNTITKSADADNSTIINYDLSRGGRAVAVRVENNRILNANPNASLLRNASDLVPKLSGNVVETRGRGRLVPIAEM